MLDIPVLPEVARVAVPTFVPAEDLFYFLLAVQSETQPGLSGTHIHEGVQMRIPEIINRRSLEEKAALLALTDRFDCATLARTIKRSINIHHDRLSSWQLMAVASKINCKAVAKRALIKMGDEEECVDGGPRFTHSLWWEKIQDLRPIWQIELNKLVWVSRQELVNRPQEYKWGANGRKISRTRETVLVQTTSSWKDIAAAFNPKSEMDV
jgi:hypothetical protein